MPSPDLTDLVDLTLYDKGPFELVDRALADAVVKLPGWRPLEGNTELVILEGVGLTVAELIYAVNRLPGAIMDVQLRFLGVTRNLGSAPTAVVRFALGDTLGHELPAGVRVLLDLGGTADPLVFTTDAPVVAAAGPLTVDSAATATRSTALANGVPAGTALTILDSIPWLNGATIAPAGEPVDGVDEEAEADWRARGRQLFTTLRSTLVLARDFTADALNWPGVYRATTIDDWDATALAGAGDVAIGHVSTYVLGEGNVPLSGGAKTALAASMDAKAQANLAVHVGDPTVTPVAVTATVHRLAAYTAAAVQANVVAALEQYLSTDTWQWEAVVRRNDLIGVLDAVEGVRYVESLTTPAADVNLPGAAPLADSGVLTITVNPA